MSKTYHLPLNLFRFDVVGSQKPASVESVTNDLYTMLSEMVDREADYCESDEYMIVAQRFISGEQLFKGQTNTLGRVNSVAPFDPFSFQNANMRSMFQTLVMNKMAGYIQSCILYTILNTHEATTMSEVFDVWDQNFLYAQKPTSYVVKAHLHRFHVKGQRSATRPSPFPSLPIYSADTHFAPKISLNHDGTFDFSIKLPSSGMTTIRFTLPDSDRFKGQINKITRPTIQDMNGQLVFLFTVEKKTPTTRSNKNILGVDLGVIEPCVATVVRDNSTFSSPYHADKNVHRLVNRIDSLYALLDALRDKAHLNEQNHRYHKAEILDTESERVRHKISRLKNELGRRIAHQLVTIADKENADIVFEDLRWTSGTGKNLSGSWNHSVIQKTTQYLSQQKGIKVKNVSAKNTSQQCSRCGKTVRHLGNRRTICNACHNQLNRDTNASRNIASRGLNVKGLLSFKQSNSVHTHVSYVDFSTSWKNVGPTPEMVTLFQGSTLLRHFISVKSVT